LAAEAAAGPQYGEEEEWEEWWEEEGGEEYAAYHRGPESGGKAEAQIEPGVLYQPLVSEEPPSDEATTGVVPLCKDATSAGCAQDAGGVGHRVGKKLQRALTKDESGTNPDEFCDLASVPGLSRAVSGGPIGIFVAVGCAAKATSEAIRG
jgi:hypothetical protein